MRFRTTTISWFFGAWVWLAACAGQTPTPSSQPTRLPPTIVPSPTQVSSLPPRIVAPTPVCNLLELTPATTEGPYYKSNPPERTSLIEPGNTGTRIVITGYVIALDCTPIARARVDFWQADDKGEYDNTGYKWRGYQLTDDAGRYYLETVMPGLYPGRTRHLHVKVQAPHQPTLTTQLYFPNESGNTTDSIFNSKLLVTMSEMSGIKVGTFNFVLAR